MRLSEEVVGVLKLVELCEELSQVHLAPPLKMLELLELFVLPLPDHFWKLLKETIFVAIMGLPLDVPGRVLSSLRALSP